MTIFESHVGPHDIHGQLLLNINGCNIVIQKRRHCRGLGRSPQVQGCGGAAPKVQRVGAEPAEVQRIWGAQFPGMREVWEAARPGYIRKVRGESVRGETKGGR